MEKRWYFNSEMSSLETFGICLTRLGLFLQMGDGLRSPHITGNKNKPEVFQGNGSALWHLLHFGAFAHETVNTRFLGMEVSTELSCLNISLVLPASCAWRVSSAQACIGGREQTAFLNVNLMCTCLFDFQ